MARLAEGKPDVILLDFMMPILDGAGMLRAMAAEPSYQLIPVIMMSSIEENVVAEKCSGYVAFLHKPSELSQCCAPSAASSKASRSRTKSRSAECRARSDSD